MSRARQVANFDPALLAADEVSGDKVHGGTISGSPTLVTPNLGTPASGVATNLTGIPAANITGVLPVGVTGGSGLTALGTVTSANLSNTAIVYPSGHIIKTGHVQAAGQSSTTTQSWNYVHDEVVLTFTPLLATSSILLHASMGTHKATAGHGQFDFYKNASDFTETYNVTGLDFGLAFCSNLTNWSAASMQWLDPVTENSTSTKTYKISLKSSDGNETYCGWGADAMCSITAWEIAV